jgi:tRNA threonylcarbamoyladenosine biosynthesis protein TsaE
MMIERLYGVDESAQVARDILAFAKDCSIITFTGSLGAGKTTLIRAILAQWGVHSGVTSPTFTYVQRYKLPDGSMVNHFDLYRLESLDPFFELGLDEYLAQEKGKVLIEWPALITDLLTGPVCHITLDYTPHGLEMRHLTAVRSE